MSGHLKALMAVVIVLGLGIASGVWWSHGGSDPAAQRAVEQLPQFETMDIDGRIFRSTESPGKLLIVNFWASWCAPCVEEVPSLVKLSNAMGDDLQILAISGDSSLEDINIFLKSFPALRRPQIRIVFDQGLSLSKKFDVGRLPESFIFDGKGRMARKVAGSIDWSTEDAIQYMRSLKGATK